MVKKSLPSGYPARLRPPVLAPSLLSADFTNLSSQIRAGWRAGMRWLHLDVMDRHFVPNLTFGAPLIRAIRPVLPDLYFDAHLMVTNPGDHVTDMVAAGCQCITIHQETQSDRTGEILKEIRARGVHAGLAIKPNTPLELLKPYLGSIDLALIMTVEPGFGGQALIPQCLSKVRDLARLRDGDRKLQFLIQVDGGINEKTAALATSSGAEVLVAGNAVFNQNPIRDNIRTLQSLMSGKDLSQ